jgi:hypothetical protein
MSFDAPDLRRGMDVFDAAGTYLGTVVWVTSRALPRPPDSPARATPAHHADQPFSGEAIGPMPTASLGNSGPRSQSPTTAYATSSAAARIGKHGARRPTELVVLRLLTSLNWSTLRPRVRRIPVSRVQAVSHERIVLAVSESDLK